MVVLKARAGMVILPESASYGPNRETRRNGALFGALHHNVVTPVSSHIEHLPVMQLVDELAFGKVIPAALQVRQKAKPAKDELLALSLQDMTCLSCSVFVMLSSAVRLQPAKARTAVNL